MDAFPDMTIREFKLRLRQMQTWTDESMRRMTSVEVVMGSTKLVDNNQTVLQAGLSPDASVQVCFTVTRI